MPFFCFFDDPMICVVKVRNAAAKHLARESTLRTFGNGGAVKIFLARMLECAEARAQFALTTPSAEKVDRKVVFPLL